jgi:hypothetical protein
MLLSVQTVPQLRKIKETLHHVLVSNVAFCRFYSKPIAQQPILWTFSTATKFPVQQGVVIDQFMNVNGRKFGA